MKNVQNKVPDTGTYIQKLELSFLLRETVLRAASRALKFPTGSQGLDIGCGIGDVTSLLAECVGRSGHVMGVDISPEMVSSATRRAGSSQQLTFRQGDMNALPFGENSFDWAWSVDCVGYAPIEPLPLIEEILRVVRPGGLIAILAWSSQQLLPGHPALEARLNATAKGIAPFVEGKNPAKHFTRALGWFHQLGLEAPKARTFVGDVQAPLSAESRAALQFLFQMRWPGTQSELNAKYWDEYQRLCQPESPDFILDLPDYYAFFTYSLFSGRVPAHG